MDIRCLKVTDVRNLVSLRLESLSKINLFFGDNGSGKTSILEAVYLLSLARSFRTKKLKSIIREGCDYCTVYGDIVIEENRWAVGVTKKKNERQMININGDHKSKVTDLISILPVQLMNPDTFGVLELGPTYRRRILDWGVYHNNREFLDIWKKMYTCLKYRNSLLRRKHFHKDEIKVWTEAFIEVGLLVHQMREYYFKCLINKVKDIIDNVFNFGKIDFFYYQGWPETCSLVESVLRSENRDIMLGYTGCGPHRADIKITVENTPIIEVCSRGQLKLMVCIIKIAQGLLYEEHHKRPCIFLIDDLLSELDDTNCRIVVNILEKMSSQLWVTGIGKEGLARIFSKNSAMTMFHVKHGNVYTV